MSAATLDNQDASCAYTLCAETMAQDLQVHHRTILRYISRGYTTLDGTIIRLPARRVRGRKGGLAWHARPADYQQFKTRIERAEQDSQASHPGQTSSMQSVQNDTGNQEHQEALRQALASIVHLSASIETLTNRLDHLENTIEQLRRPRPRRPRPPHVGNAPSAPDPSEPPAPQPVQTAATGEAPARPGCLGRWVSRLTTWKSRVQAALTCLKRSPVSTLLI